MKHPMSVYVGTPPVKYLPTITVEAESKFSALVKLSKELDRLGFHNHYAASNYLLERELHD